MRPRVISLFSGAGGLDYGLEAAGFETAVALEMSADCCVTMRTNRPKWAVIEDDIMNVSSETLLDAARARPGKIELLVGGPPCQPFSKAGYWSSGDSLRLDDPRANTLGAYMRVVEDTLPAAFLLENVEGLAYEGKDEGLKFLLDRLEQINRKAKSHYARDFEAQLRRARRAPAPRAGDRRRGTRWLRVPLPRADTHRRTGARPLAGCRPRALPYCLGCDRRRASA